MGEIVPFPAGRFGGWPDTNDMVEALGIAALAANVWLDTVTQIENGTCRMLGPDRWPAEPTITFAGNPASVSLLLERTAAVTGPLPAILQAISRFIDLTNDGNPNEFAQTVEGLREHIADVIECGREIIKAVEAPND